MSPIRWPWVSRLAFDIVVETNTYLREQNERLTDTALRVRRKEAGMPESHVRDRPPVHDDMPPEVLRYVQGFESDAMRNALEDDVLRARQQGTPWAEIIDILEHDMED